MANRARRISSTLIAFILATSGILALFPTAAHASGAGANWDGPWANSQNWNNNPQTQVTTSNVGNIKAEWIFPFPAYTELRPSALIIGGSPAIVPSTQGPGTPPLIHDGVLYEGTQNYDIYAFDAATGKVIWHYVVPIHPGTEAYHQHAIRYYNGMIWTIVPGWGWDDVLGVDALTGDLKMNISGISRNIPGQRYSPLYNTTYTTRWLYSPEWPPTFYKNIALVQLSTIDLLLRGFFAAYDINTGKMLWRFYTSPPAPNCDPNWDFENLVDLGNGTTVNYGQLTCR